jgi:hypothetical protein
MAKRLNFRQSKNGGSAKTINYFQFLRLLLIFATVITGIGADLSAQKDADYLIFENVNALVIYNRYEQQLTVSEKTQFPAFAPFQILEKSTLLSDNFSTAMKIGLEGQIYYLLLTETGTIKNLSQANVLVELKKASEIGDSLVVVRNEVVYLRFPDRQQSQRPLLAGELIVRNLRHKNRFYGRLIGGDSYGWIITRQKDDLRRPLPVENEDSGFSSTEIDAVRNRISRINNQIERLFTLFNQQTAKDLTPPRWQIIVNPTKIECFIDPNYSNFARTGKKLRSGISSILYRHRLDIRGNPNHFTIGIEDEAGL